MTIVTIRELQHNMSGVVRETKRGNRVRVTRYGKPLFTIIPNDEESEVKTHTFADIAKLHFHGDPNLSKNIDEVLYSKKA